MPTPMPWSHSSLQGFGTCPRQYEEVKVLRNFKSADNPASLWGNEFHTAAELYLKGGAALGERFTGYKDYLDQFLAMPGKLYAEQEYALDRALRPCAFSGPEVWGRGIIDVLVLNGTHAHVADHKTGVRKKDMQQLVIFALLVFYHHPEIETCETTYRWLKTNEIDTETFHRSGIAAMWETLIPKLQRYAQAFHVGVFPARPSGLCRKHCPVETCEYVGIGMYRG